MGLAGPVAGKLSGRVAGDLASIHAYTADAFGADLATLFGADPAVESYWLAFVDDSSSWRTLGAGGVFSLNWVHGLGDKLTQTAAAQQPSIDSAGPNGRGRVAFDAAANQYFETANTLPALTTGRRCGMICAGRSSDGTPAARQALAASVSSYGLGGGAYVLIDRLATGELQAYVHYDDGGTGAFDTHQFSENDSSTDPFYVEAWCTDPHTFVFGTTEYTSAQTAGGSARLAVATHDIIFGNQRSGAGGAAYNWDGDGYLVGSFRLGASYSDVPSCMAQVRTAIRRYYGPEVIP